LNYSNCTSADKKAIVIEHDWTGSPEFKERVAKKGQPKQVRKETFTGGEETWQSTGQSRQRKTKIFGQTAAEE